MRLVTIEIDGEPMVHLPSSAAQYDTLCGIDGDDPGIGHVTVETEKGAKVDCLDCRRIYEDCQGVRRSIFV